ncbi:MAG: tRNA dihydrouridine synthase DusB [Spirochaetes bacterium GWB1_59_5]|nr:MAG: tRNA dihydrouridine synthase DusB [Spirochaetes bacterium GWB1_59_5]
MNLHVPVRIGNYTTRGNLFLAPVAGYSDAAYRSVCTDAGCDLAYTEMVSSEALTRGHLKTEVLLAREDNEPDYAVQLFGSHPDVMARAARIVVERWNPAIIDVNCGCPVPKIVKSGCGSALMHNPGLMRDIVEAMVAAVSVPITVKFRLGWDDSSINYLEFAAAAVEGGASALTLHARTREQGYAGKAFMPAFYALAAAVKVPVIASGDLDSAAAAVNILSGGSAGARVAGVMFARGAMGDPFIFTRARAALEGLPEPEITATDRMEAARRHLEVSMKSYGERTACVEFRKQACAYLKGTPGGAELRKQAVSCVTVEDYKTFFAAWTHAIERARTELSL